MPVETDEQDDAAQFECRHINPSKAARPRQTGPDGGEWIS